MAAARGIADGTGSNARFNQPYDITIDNAGNLYVADRVNDTIRKITPVVTVKPRGTNWVVTTIAGMAGIAGSTDGANINALFFGPQGITADGASNLYVADAGNHTLRKITPVGTNWVNEHHRRTGWKSLFSGWHRRGWRGQSLYSGTEFAGGSLNLFRGNQLDNQSHWWRQRFQQ
ncbi:MAG: hypothetical protein WDM76_18345 [Limisphaerales bacterium]